MDDQTREFVETFQAFLRDVVNQSTSGDDRLTAFGEVVEQFLGESLRPLPVVTHLVAPHRLVDLDVALASIAGETYEYTQMYPGFAKTAREEGHVEIAEWFETLARAEKSHAGRFQQGLESLSAL